MSGSVIPASQPAQPPAAYSHGLVGGAVHLHARNRPNSSDHRTLGRQYSKNDIRSLIHTLRRLSGAVATTFAQVVKMNAHLHDMKLHSRFQRAFGECRPKSPLGVTVARINLDALKGIFVEIDCIAHLVRQ
jgi:enamine deaminase RidA (YjgF/YER057c/UK114 family)